MQWKKISNLIMRPKLAHIILLSMFISSCTVIEPAKKFDIENENRIRDLSIRRDFVSPEERDVIDSELRFRKTKRDGLVMFDPLHFSGNDDAKIMTYQAAPENKNSALNPLLNKQLGRSSDLTPEIKEKALIELIEKNWGAQSERNNLLLKTPLNARQEPTR
ncbi:hypothetical protein [Geobacter sp. SVR]|uniref:hypothetical protein n=1 Tax=Geobacter sp. SVR TaxID=2495594 RepID=UPI00143EFF96|nr:hypothetical protein [Geobacter sp. SVR]BCS54424.1 hypothetical protein GSVR_27320 [Geobacter sp. SVR]GCF87655.1 hypothetical protein GSbR_42550 [Geobacter sp. SVR]